MGIFKKNADSGEQVLEEKKTKTASSQKLNKFCKIWIILYLIALLVFEGALVIIDILPEMYLLISFVIILIISVVLFIQLFFKNVKRGRKIAALIIATILMALYVAGSVYIFMSNAFLSVVAIGSGADSDIMESSFNVYISGVDTSDELDETSARSDANMVLTINPQTGTILMTSIPRDSRITIQGVTEESAAGAGQTDKLTHTGVMGIEETVACVEDLLDIEIDYYIKVNYTALVELVDAIGGIEVYSDYTFTYYKGTYSFVEGINELDGEAALAFSRERKAFTYGDRQRAINQQRVIQGIIEKLTSSTTLLTSYSSILDSLSGNVEFSFSSDEIKAIIKYQLLNGTEWTIESSSVTGSDSTETTYSTGSTKVYVMALYTDSIQAAHDLIEEVYNATADDVDSEDTDSTESE